MRFIGFLPLIILVPALQASHAGAHSTAVYAGTHLVDFAADPLAPFPGEKVHFTFRLLDFRYQFPEEPFVLWASVLDSEADSYIFSTTPVTTEEGMLEFDYAFEKAGSYDIVFEFRRPDESDIARDGFFHMEVREPPVFTALSVFLIVLAGAAAAVFAGLLLSVRRTSRRQERDYSFNRKGQ